MVSAPSLSILLDDDWRIKITDFGSAKVVDPIALEPVEFAEGSYPKLKLETFLGADFHWLL
jgi:serine/threonine protein kinase